MVLCEKVILKAIYFGHQDYCVKYLFTLVFRSQGGNNEFSNIYIYFIFSFISMVGFYGETSWDIWGYKGFWVTEVLRKEFKRSQRHAAMLYKHILNCTVLSTELAPQLHLVKFYPKIGKVFQVCLFVCSSVLSQKP